MQISAIIIIIQLKSYFYSIYTDLLPTYQGSLIDLTPPFEVLNMNGLPVGTYAFFFAVDTKMNGSLDLDQLYSDIVIVNFETPPDRDGDGYTENQGDCNDNNASIYPGATEICGDDIDQDCNGSDLDCSSGECTNIAGNWFGRETVTLTCCQGGDCETETISGTNTITIQQSGCNVSYNINISGYGTFTRTGTIQGNKIQMSGKFVIPLIGGINITQNIITLEGTINGNEINLNGSGIATGTFEGMSFSCTGNSTTVLTRAATSSLFIEKETIREPSLLFLNNSLNLFFTVFP